MEEDERIGIAGSREVPNDPPRKIDDNGDTSWCSGGHCLIRRSALKETGYLDEKFFIYGEDVDLCWRMWLAGYRCVRVAEAVCEHHGGRQEGYLTRRKYFHVRNSLLLRYAYGNRKEIGAQSERWFREALSLSLKKGEFRESWPVFCALAGHIPLIPYFLKKGAGLKQLGIFKKTKEQWIWI
jgi:GT2 family glycosyltransferase